MNLSDDQLKTHLNKLIKEGDERLSDSGPSNAQVDLRWFTNWRSRCINLLKAIPSGPWHNQINGSPSHNRAGVERILGALDGIITSFDEGLLSTYRNLILQEAGSDLFEQATQLFTKQYFVAAAVVARCVLENHLRLLCEREDRKPEKAKGKPMFNDFNMALYKEMTDKTPMRFYDQTTMEWLQGLGTIGNKAAHEKIAPEPDVKRMIEDIPEFRKKYPLSVGKLS